MIILIVYSFIYLLHILKLIVIILIVETRDLILF